MTEKLDLTWQLFNLFTAIDQTPPLSFYPLVLCQLLWMIFSIAYSSGVLSEKYLQQFPRGEKVK